MKQRLLIVNNDRKTDAARIRSQLGKPPPRVDEVPTVAAALRVATKHFYSAVILIAPCASHSAVDHVKVLRQITTPLLVYCADEHTPDSGAMLRLGVLETVTAALPDADLANHLKRFLQRNSEFFQPYDEATRSGSETASYVPMDDESTCWYCLEQGKASIEHNNFESAKKWLHLVLRIDPDHEQAQRLQDFIVQNEDSAGRNG
ncbi:MAG: hypothetical protein EA404_14230 [Spirochaetaceae bacterium]|nr:MAG: hypothetical protein EA404_14230 [Spirochaetaceae bacterium]